MNEYKFSDLHIGLSESFEHTITEEDMQRFLATTGDINPLHNDENYATEKGFDNRVVFGMLSASLISTLAGVYLPGKYCLIQQAEIKFTNPVYVGDLLTIKGTIKELNESVQQGVVKVEITNQSGKKVVRGSLNVGFLE